MFKRMILAVASTALVSLPAVSLAGGSVDVALTHESVQVEHGAVREGTAAYLTVGGWYHMDNGRMVHAGFHAIDPNNSRPELIAGLGGKTYLFKVPGQDTSVTVGLGGFARYNPSEFNGFGGELAAYYSPPVLAFSDLDQFFDVQARVTYEVLPQGRVFVGYGYMMADYPDAEVELESTVNLGFRVRY